MGPSPEIRCAVEVRNLLGEGPVWCPIDQAVYWVDIREPSLHRVHPKSGVRHRWPMPEEIGSFALRRDRGALVALRSRAAFFDFATGDLETLCAPEADLPENRFNDGKCDRRGRFWVGTMHAVERRTTGALYRLDPDGSWHRVLDDVTVPNCLAWSPDSRTMYFADSPHRTIWAFDFDLDDGVIGNRRVFASLPEGVGFPDGATVDADGCLWNAHWDGWRLTRYAPDGRIQRVVQLPVPRPTSCAFGGPGLDTLYVTTASVRLTAGDLGRAPLSGAVLALEPGVRGLPEPRFAG